MERELKEKAMKTKIIQIIAVAVLVFAYITNSAKAVITDVEITPAEPTMEDIISIVTSGVEGAGDVFVTDTDFRTDGTSLELDIFLDVGVFPAFTPWSYSKQIGTLNADTYRLEVNAIPYGYTIPADTYIVDFTVVPEPATFALFGLGLLIVRPLLRRKRQGLNA